MKKKKDTHVVRLRNINTGWKVQITKYNYDMMLRNNKCYGKVQAPEAWNIYFSKTKVRYLLLIKKSGKLFGENKKCQKNILVIAIYAASMENLLSNIFHLSVHWIIK